MNLPNAKEILTKERKEHHSFSTDIIGQAEQIGIEAIERIQKQRSFSALLFSQLLPSETEE